MNLHSLSAFLTILAISLPVCAQGVDLPEPLVSAEDIQKAIEVRVQQLNQMMDPKVFWGKEDPPHTGIGAEGINPGARSCLAGLALLYAGESPKSERMQRLIKFLAEVELYGTYGTGIRASFWSKLKDPKVKPLLARDAEALMKGCSVSDKKPVGAFSYGANSFLGSPEGGDHSNTQYGVLGLRDASIRGVEVPNIYWEAIQKHMIEAQALNGGWGYWAHPKTPLQPNETYPAMTLACLCNLYITLDRLQSTFEGAFNGEAAKGCGRRKQPDAIDMGLAWLDRNLASDFKIKPVNHDDNSGDSWREIYDLYGLERCGNANGRKIIGGLNWFQQGALRVMANRSDRSEDIDWAILFLAKGQAPVFYNKLDTHADWNNDIMDIPNISEYVGEQLEQKINWQVVDLKDKVEEWLDAPILFFNGHTFPKFSDEDKKKLRLYTDSGGTLVAEACCSMPDFVTGFKKLAKEVWPEWELQMVEKNHPVMTFQFNIKEKTPRMMHMFDGCRDRVFLITQDISCAWNQNMQERYPGYFQLGMNLARYASDGRPLRSRIVWTPGVARELAAQGKARPAPGAETKITIADWPAEGRRLTDIRGLRHLAETLKENFNITAEIVNLENNSLDKLAGVRVLHMSGHQTFASGPEMVKKLQDFIAGGGLIWADAQCGRPAFNESFQALAPKLAPGTSLAKIAKEDPLITGQGLPISGFDVTSIRYKSSLKTSQFAPSLQELKVNGRRAVIYSPLDLTCGLDGHDCANCLGPIRNDALKIASNIVLSALPAEAPAAPPAVPASTDQPAEK